MDPARRKFLDAKEVAAILNIELHTFRKLVSSGEFPLPTVFTPKVKQWSKFDVRVMKWLVENKHRFAGQTEEDEEADAD
jgi:predicted DNA-binding transcriptional regulator AlpA